MKTTNKKTAETQQIGISEIQHVSMSHWDQIIYCDIQRQIPVFKDCIDKLGVVLEEMAQMLDIDGKGIDVYLLQYVADARQTLRALLLNMEMKAPTTEDLLHKS